jgi:hypothetical protein
MSQLYEQAPDVTIGEGEGYDDPTTSQPTDTGIEDTGSEE